MQSVIIRIMTLHGAHPCYHMLFKIIYSHCRMVHNAPLGKYPTIYSSVLMLVGIWVVSSFFVLFCFFAIVSRTTWNILTHVFQWTDGCISLRNMPRNGIARLESFILIGLAKHFFNVAVSICPPFQVILRISPTLCLHHSVASYSL